MAASSSSASNPSPSNKSVAEHSAVVDESGTMKVNPETADTAAASSHPPDDDGVATGTTDNGGHATVAPPLPPPQLKAPPPPSSSSCIEHTFESSEASDHYMVAKSLLNDGDFESALTAIVEGLELVQAQVGGDDELHPALAPFHYMYGTTLLYSIEECTDDQALATTVSDHDHDDDEEDHPDDMQVAFEHLEAARIILDGMFTKTEQQALALAQVYLRLGDLHRLNGRYVAALADYESCWQHRQPWLGPYDRKLADVHYNLGLTMTLYLADPAVTNGTTTNGLSTAAAGDDAEVAAAAGAANANVPDMEEPLTDADKQRLRAQSFQHYLACTKVLGGQLALLAGQEPAAFLARAAQPDRPCRFKSTGDDNDDNNGGTMTAGTASLQIAALLQHVRDDLDLPNDDDDDHEACATATSLLELLEEIHETLDNCEVDETGVHEAAQMKAAIAASVAAAAAAHDNDEGAVPAHGNGSTTQIGFGSNGSSSSNAVAAAAAAAGGAAQPVMLVRSKKRAAHDAKLLPSDPAAAKEPKT